jgi:hypothetical protein
VNTGTFKHSNSQTFISPRRGFMVANDGRCYKHIAPPERIDLDARFELDIRDGA